ncbi:unnamed protein product [Oppiella nova]|uniref:Uncharacterized protein n=1 Tax=Oppiella nova TaxID=334625 RepID=A0A7R9MB48_9ACAR|nr:unnamed protein product [Oppiella nova]CAG2174149.1 unnamed protein product [Oppiella nova]
MIKSLVIILLDENHSMDSNETNFMDNSQRDYPRVGQPLYEAITEGLQLAAKGTPNPDDRLVCVVMSDGLNGNSSQETTQQMVKDIVSGYETGRDWTFVYTRQSCGQWTTSYERSKYSMVNTNPMRPNFAVSAPKRCGLPNQHRNQLSRKLVYLL